MKNLNALLKTVRDSRYGLPLAVMALGVGLSVLASSLVRESETRLLQTRFETRSADIRDIIQSRFAQYEEVLRGAQGLFAASHSVERDEWDAYVGSLNLMDHFPGIAGMSFAARVPAEQLKAHIAEQRAQGLHNYRVYPEGARQQYFPIVYSSPAIGGPRLGFDVFSDVVRSQAMIQAQSSGVAKLSGRVVLAVDADIANPPAAAVLTLPVYRNGAPQNTVAERQAAVEGNVAGVFRMPELMPSLLGSVFPDLNLEVFYSKDG